jgi:hypothetical protein
MEVSKMSLFLWGVGALVAVIVLFIAYVVIRYWGDDGSLDDHGRPDIKKLF